MAHGVGTAASLQQQVARRDAALAAGAVAVVAVVCACCSLLCKSIRRKRGKRIGHSNEMDGAGIGMYDATVSETIERSMGMPGALEREEGMPLQLQLGMGELVCDDGQQQQQGYGI